MNGTKENILLTALELFSRSGYEAVSVSDIAGRLGMTKSALYKHYKNKRDIFDSITARMEQRDAERSRLFELPEEAMTEGSEDYSAASLRQLIEFSKAQLRYWTEDEFASAFRRLLTLEQYRDGEMRAMYQQYLAGGPLGYVADILGAHGLPNAEREAMEFYAPMFLFYSLYDGAKDKSSIITAADAHFERFLQKWEGMDNG